VLELLFGLAILTILAAAAIPQVLVTIDASRTLAAARFLSSRLMLARMMAVQRTAAVAVRFDSDARGYRLTMFQDGNRNGVLSKDIAVHLDPEIEEAVRLFELFPGVDLGLSIDGQAGAAVQLGGTSLLTFTPRGTATSGSVYLRGRDGSQYVVRVLGATGRTRVLFFDPRQQRWAERF
jgi:type II secretory pathway pseudopilin PulG